MKFDRLLAKSKPKPWEDQTLRPSIYLPVHLQDVRVAAEQVLGCTGNDQMAAMGLPSADWQWRFRRVVTLAAALHDLGKANDHFQEMVRGERKMQGIRHEWVTILILQQYGFRDWLLP